MNRIDLITSFQVCGILLHRYVDTSTYADHDLLEGLGEFKRKYDELMITTGQLSITI